MELRELIQILRREVSLYAFIIVFCLIAGLVWHALQPERYQANLLLNVGRTEGAVSSEFNYDEFYRLQADERFGDTLVRWLDSSRVTEDIFREAELPQPAGLGGYFTGRRLSSQVVEVTYQVADQTLVQPLAKASVDVSNRYTQSLNPEAGSGRWFRVIGSDPVVEDARVSQATTLLAALAIGIFFGFWIVLIKHYFKESDAHRD